MNPEEFKARVNVLLGNDVAFLGDKIDIVIRQLSTDACGRIFRWLEEMKLRQKRPIRPDKGQTYKGMNTSEILVFRLPLSVQGIAYRILLVKIRNSYYWEFHLGDHDYYDKIRKNLHVRESSVREEEYSAVLHRNS